LEVVGVLGKPIHVFQTALSVPIVGKAAVVGIVPVAAHAIPTEGQVLVEAVSNVEANPRPNIRSRNGRNLSAYTHAGDTSARRWG
jgi:ABC-type phosphate/phosphonate transport system permease subunit